MEICEDLGSETQGLIAEELPPLLTNSDKRIANLLHVEALIRREGTYPLGYRTLMLRQSL
jgi:hypothetical protein